MNEWFLDVIEHSRYFPICLESRTEDDRVTGAEIGSLWKLDDYRSGLSLSHFQLLQYSLSQHRPFYVISHYEALV